MLGLILFPLYVCSVAIFPDAIASFEPGKTCNYIPFKVEESLRRDRDLEMSDNGNNRPFPSAAANKPQAKGLLETDAPTILEGATEVEISQSAIYPALLVVYGKNAFPFLVAKGSGSVLSPVAAASKFGDGRFVVFGHHEFVRSQSSLINHNEVLIRACKWASRFSSGSNQQQRVGLHGGDKTFLALLKANGYASETLSPSKLSDSSPLNAFQLVIVPNLFNIPAGATSALYNYVKAGGALVVGCASWYYDKTFCRGDEPGNQLIRESGIVWTGEPAVAVPLSKGKAGATGVMTDLQAANGASSAQVIMEALNQNTIPNANSIKALFSSIRQTIESVDKKYIDWADEFKSTLLRADILHKVVPTKSNPVHATQENVFYMDLTFILTSLSSPEELRPNPAADYFPGKMTYDTQEVKVAHTISIDLVKNAKRFLGPDQPELPCQRRCTTTFYAPPASPVTITIDPPVKGFQLIIGCHSSDLSIKNDTIWSRFPRISFKKDVLGTTRTLSNPFGGMVYVKDIIKATENQTKVTLTLTGVVHTGSFILEQHSLDNWKERRQIQTPYMEFITDKMVLALPYALAASVEDPVSLMKWWNSAIEHHSDLLGVPSTENFQSVVFDMQLGCSGCGMYAGYPIMAFLGSAEYAVNLTILSSLWKHDDNWAFHHEIGHNHQNPDWTYAGGGEVTNNIFTMYIGNTLVGEPMATVYNTPKKMAVRLKSYIDRGVKYADFSADANSDPLQPALLFFWQLQHLYGWDPYKAVFRKYRSLTKGQHPKTDEDKWDMWLVHFSNQVGQDLSPLFSSWGLPITSKGKASVSTLPPTNATLQKFYEDTNRISCVDDNLSCVGWASEGECKGNPGWMNDHCPKSCGVC